MQLNIENQVTTQNIETVTIVLILNPGTAMISGSPKTMTMIISIVEKFIVITTSLETVLERKVLTVVALTGTETLITERKSRVFRPEERPLIAIQAKAKPRDDLEPQLVRLDVILRIRGCLISKMEGGIGEVEKVDTGILTIPKISTLLEVSKAGRLKVFFFYSPVKIRALKINTSSTIYQCFNFDNDDM